MLFVRFSFECFVVVVVVSFFFFFSLFNLWGETCFEEARSFNVALYCSLP